jgi:tRNA1Val (adenine37-N6)-methyltransferase
MPNSFFQFKQFRIDQEHCAMKVTTDSCLFGAWVAQTLASAGRSRLSLLDIGTGTGLLSLMIAQKNQAAHIEAIEIDSAACDQAAQNIASAPFPKDVSTRNEDILKDSSHSIYDIIVSNPPFYENELKSPDAFRNVAHHGELLSLAALLQVIQQRLHPEGGQFFLLLPYKRKNEFMRLAADQGLPVSTLINVRQTTNHGFFRLMIHGCLGLNSEPGEEELAIRNHNNEYTPAFAELLREYYLYL